MVEQRKSLNNYSTYSHHPIRALLGAMAALVVADGIISQFLITKGFAYEGNPFLRHLVGDERFLSIKVAGAFLATTALWYIYKRRPRLAFAVTICFLVFYTIVVFWNLYIFFFL